jgi:DNA-binding CsgD family transcriptional regulator
MHQRIADDILRMRRLGMTFEAIGVAVGVNEKTVRNVLRRVNAARE